MLPLLCDSAELADRQAVRCKKEALENVLLCSSKGNVTMRGHKPNRLLKLKSSMSLR
jgi:hypothetical protein